MKKLFFLIIIMITLAACTMQGDGKYGRPVSVAFVNVGYGDCIILTVNEMAYLIDTGSEKSVPSLFRGLSAMGVERIDGLFLTHTHQDHIGGTEALVQEYQVDRLYSAEISKATNKGKNKIVQLADKLGLHHTMLKADDLIEVEKDVSFKVIAPIEYNYEDDNDNSLVLMLELNGKRFLLTGDLQFFGERVILNSGAEIDAHILKVGNHGNKDATSPAFAEAVSPDYAIISTSTAEDSGSANKRVISALNPAEILITQNYENGIRITVDINGDISVGSL